VLTQATAAGLLIDARSYYRAFYRAARQARHYVLLAGWRFNSDVRLLRGPDADEAGGEVKLLPFLRRLCEENPRLQVCVLAWDYSINYALEWERSQESKFRLPSGDRLRFLYDGQHAIGGSHHQKFVVVDGEIAFVGGLDFAADDWDDRQHLAFHPDRADSGQEPHPPYHDIQAYLAGPAAAELADYFRRRWQVAGGGELKLPLSAAESSLRIAADAELPAGPVALSRTQPRTLSDAEPAHEVRQLYLDAVASAGRLIYLENQYFSSQVVFEALRRRLEDTGRGRLEVVIVLPKRCYSWVEAAATGGPRVRMLEDLRQAARRGGHRLGVYYTAADADGREVPVLIHSKLMAVDDRLLTVGSANLSNRSMGLDTELNVTWEAASSGDEALAAAIRGARVSLLAEHCSLPGAAAELARVEGLVEYLDGLAEARRGRLRLLTSVAFFDDHQWLKILARWGFSFDPGRPAIEETLHEALALPAAPWGRRLRQLY
jgi:phosphatidylserine/phosphatidylglycerophosphate/cardiolipin synthase-like enzyme